MSKYRIKVRVEFVECDKNEDEHLPEEQAEGGFDMVIDEKDAISIDKSEKALLMTAYPTIRKAVADHLERISKKKPLKRQRKTGWR